MTPAASDTLWQTVRYVLLALGGFLAGKGIIPADQVAGLVDKLINVAPGLIAVGTAVWGLFVKSGTATVPASTAARADVPTVSAATGVVTK